MGVIISGRIAIRNLSQRTQLGGWQKHFREQIIVFYLYDIKDPVGAAFCMTNIVSESWMFMYIYNMNINVSHAL
jgi:hypothetical protein